MLVNFLDKEATIFVVWILPEDVKFVDLEFIHHKTKTNFGIPSQKEI